MAKTVSDLVLDAALNKVATATRKTVCSGASAPGTVTDVDTAALAQVTGLTSAHYTIANGDTSGRKATVAASTGVSITATGDATHIVLDDGTNVLYVTTCTTQSLTSGGTVDIPAWDIEIADPS